MSLRVPNVALIFPPFVDPRAPYLALPSLAAYLRSGGRPVTVHDFNLWWFRQVLSSDYLATVLDKGLESKFVIDNVGEAVRTFADLESFSDADKYAWARNILDLALMLLSSRYHGWELSLRSPCLADKSLSDATKIVLSETPTPFTSLLSQRLARMLNHHPDLVIGVSVANMSQLCPAMEIARAAKLQNATVIVGGATITLLRDELEKWSELGSFFDGAVLFEGEAAMKQVIENMTTSQPLFQGVENCVFRDQEKNVLRNRPFALDLNDLPTPDYSDLPLHEYFSPYPVLPLNSSKGCAWGRCTFCSIPTTSSSGGERSRRRSLSKIVDDIAQLRRRYNTPYFFFVDENLEQIRLLQIARELTDAGGGAKWIAFARFESLLDSEAASTLAKGGCKKLLMGLESASPRILRLMKKGISLATVDSNLRALSAAGVAVNLFCIVGFPTETTHEMLQTLQFVCERLELLRRPGFSCSFSEFILDPWSPLASTATLQSPLETESSMTEGVAMRRRCNSVVNDLVLPLEMIGWEEHSLIMIDFPERTDSRARLSTGEIDQRLNNLHVKLKSRPWLLIAGHTAAKRQLSPIVCRDNARMIRCSSAVHSLLQRLENGIELGELYKQMGVASADQKKQVTAALSVLWKTGFVAEIRE